MITSAVPEQRGRGHVIIAVPNCDLSSLLKNHAMCPGGSISPIVHSHDPKRSPFFLGSSHSRFPCSQEMSLPYTSHAFCGASTDLPSLILLTPLSPLPSCPRKEWLSPRSESCPFLSFQRSLCAQYHTPSYSGYLSSSSVFLPFHEHINIFRS